MRTRDFLQIIIEQSNVPVIVDAGIGTPSHAAEAMELGADAVVGMRYASASVMQGAAEVIAYGTAVRFV